MKPFYLKCIFALFLFFIILINATGCGLNKKEEQVQPQEVKPATMQVVVYYLKTSETDSYLVREIHTVPYTPQVARVALEELINGAPTTAGAFRVLSPDTKVRSINIAEDGLATVDFSKEVLKANVGSSGEALGIQSIVNTLTEYPNINQVAFNVEGGIDQRAREWWGHVGLYEQPFKRNLSVVREPVIWVNEPQPGTEINSPLTVSGTAMVFEAMVTLRLVDSNGQVLTETHTSATAGAPERGDFKTTMNFIPPAEENGYLEALWHSPKDGAELDKVQVPVKFKK